jgi:hypothetical protein
VGYRFVPVGQKYEDTTQQDSRIYMVLQLLYVVFRGIYPSLFFDLLYIIFSEQVRSTSLFGS